MFRTVLTAALLSTSALAATNVTTPADQAAREKAFDAQVSSAEQMAWLKQMSSAPNHVGSAHNKENAQFILAKFREWGWDAKIEQFDVLYPTPISTALELVTPERVVLGGQEPSIPEDSTSGNLKDALPPYVAFQGDGDVTAPVVYVNYGLPADYEALARRGVDVKGKIALARYGGGWRGLKPKLAQEHGAVGTLIYSDPANDGYATNETYPKGGSRPPNAVQRGSVADMTTYPGDPLTPGVGAAGGQAAGAGGRADDHEDPGAADFLCRCDEDLCCAWAARWRRRNGAAPCPLPIASAATMGPRSGWRSSPTGH